ncbi:MAG: MFS transporter [Armatimonadota bacterium]
MSRTLAPRLWTPAFVTVATASLAYFVGLGMLLPVLPRYVQGPLHGGSAAVGLVLGSFSVTALLLRPWVGRLGDRRGRRLLILAGTAVFGLSVIGYAVATSIPSLLLMRLLAGAGEALFFVGAASAVADMAPVERRGEAVSLFSLALWAGLGVGPFVGEAVLGENRFVAVWVGAAGIIGLAFVLGLRIPDAREPGEVSGGSRHLIHPTGVVPGVVLLTSIWGYAGFVSFVPLYALDLGLSGSRLLFAMFSAVVLTVRSLGARIPDRFGAALTARVAFIGSMIGLVAIGVWREPSGLFVGSLVYALGQSLAFPALMTLAVNAAPPSERGAVVATFTAFLDLAFGLGPVTLGLVAVALGYGGMFLSAAFVAGLGFLLLVRSTSHPKPA